METTNTPQNTSQEPSNRSKGWIYGIIAILIVAGLIWAFNQGDRKAPGDYTFDEIKSLPSEEQQKAFENKVSDLQERLKNLAQDAGEQAKYRILIGLAEAQVELGRWQDALNSLDQIPEGQKRNPPVLKAYALAYKGLGQNDKAVESFRNALAEDNTNAEIWLAYLESSTGLPNDQLNALYRGAIAATKSQLDIMISYAKFSERIGDKATAIAAWETAINHDPGNEAKYREEINRLRQ